MLPASTSWKKATRMGNLDGAWPPPWPGSRHIHKIRRVQNPHKNRLGQPWSRGPTKCSISSLGDESCLWPEPRRFPELSGCPGHQWFHWQYPGPHPWQILPGRRGLPRLEGLSTDSNVPAMAATLPRQKMSSRIKYSNRQGRFGNLPVEAWRRWERGRRFQGPGSGKRCPWPGGAAAATAPRFWVAVADTPTARP